MNALPDLREVLRISVCADGVVRVARFLGDGSGIVLASRSVVARAPPTGPATMLYRATPLYRVLDVSADASRLLMTGPEGGAVTAAWTSTERAVALVGHDGTVDSALFAGADSVVTAATDGTVRLWSLEAFGAPPPRGLPARALTPVEIDAVRSGMPRCLSARQREDAGLTRAPPAWCAGKWPY